MKLSPLDLRRKQIIGNTLIKGPRSIFPPHDPGQFVGWLEPTLFISYKDWESLSNKSIILYSDYTMNREKDFFTPLVRQTNWIREQDQLRSAPMPNINIDYWEVQDWDAINATGKQIQEALREAPLIPHGIPKDRSAPETGFAGNGIEYCVITKNGAQSLEFWSFELDNDQLFKLLIKASSILLSASRPMDMTGWRERYNHEIEQSPDISWPSWDWEIGQGFNGNWSPTIAVPDNK